MPKDSEYKLPAATDEHREKITMLAIFDDAGYI
jgi:hypothetical protein